MIGPGWLPGYKASLRKPPLTRPYTRMRRRSRPRVNKRDPSPGVVNTDLVLFDHGPTEFPVATAVPREARGRAIAIAADLRRWLAARWAWFRPRTVPCAVAALGMIAVIASAYYLAHQHDDLPAPRSVRVSVSP